MHVVVGCPVRNRAWVLPTWFEHVDRAFHALDLTLTYAFAIGSCDDDTQSVIEAHAPRAITVETAEDPIPETAGRWSHARFHELATARNKLLSRVRLEEPDFFLSLDSDILINESCVPNLMQTYETHDWAAVGGRLYMTPSGTHCPSYAFNKPAWGLAREDSEGVFRCDIIMALKLIGPAALEVDYRYNDKGEDVGWSLACRDAGLSLGWDGRAVNKHVMNRDQLRQVDERVGY